MKTLLLSLALLAASPLSLSFAEPTPPQSAPAAAPVNLALNKKYVSSDPNKSNWNPGLTDGFWQATRGHTYATGNSSTFPKTVTIDLEAPASIGYVALGVPPFGSTKTITVSLSADDKEFTEVGSYVFSLKKEEKHLFTLAPVTARYVRLTYPDHYEENAGYPPVHAFTTEVEVYAPGVAPTLTPIVPAPAPSAPEPADVAAPKRGPDGNIQPGFLAAHESFLKRGKEGKIGALFLGDSITAGWKGQGAKIWQEHFSQYDPANFGIGGDRTQHVLWRIANGELDGISPKVVVLMIGTNNIGYPPEEITKGVKKIVEQIHAKLPDTKLMLLGIFPRGAEATNPARAKIKAVNAELAKLDDGNKTRYLDIGDKFLDAEGNLPKDIMPDFLHPNAKGYQIWADAIQPLLDEMMK
ncbi:MAG: GDSL-type esterase/lipase family protein [Armatimonadota bacterium]|nr:GDSL-type esterase/lipase family protein [Armatimonadota bacterium]